MRLFFAATLMLLSMTLARAQSTVTQNLSVNNEQPALSGNLGFAYNSNFARQDTSDSEQSVSGDLVLNYRVKNAHLLRAYVGGAKELTQGQEWLPTDGFVSWVNNGFWHRGKTLIVGQQVRAHVPMSKDSRKRDTKVSGVSLIPVIIVNVAPTLTFIYQPNLTRNFHTYEENREGRLNAEYGLSHTFLASWAITDNLYFQPTYIYRNSWSYGGTRRNPSYLASGELGYGLGSGFTVAAGWTNDQAMTRAAVGADRDFQAFNNETSTFYTAVYWVF